MTRTELHNLQELQRILSKNAPDTDYWRDAETIHKAARSLHHLAEVECNGDLSKRQATRQANLGKQVTALLTERGAVKVQINGDPRGYAVKAVFPTGEYNTWGGRDDGFGIG